MAQPVSVLREWRADVVARALEGLVEARLPHYSREGEAELEQRLLSLFDHVLECLVRQCEEPAVRHAKQVAQQRHGSGYQLGEIQTSINVLEEALWQRILGSFEPEDALGALGRTNAVFGIMKDTLAQSYLQLTVQAAATEPPVRPSTKGYGSTEAPRRRWWRSESESESEAPGPGEPRAHDAGPRTR